MTRLGRALASALQPLLLEQSTPYIGILKHGVLFLYGSGIPIQNLLAYQLLPQHLVARPLPIPKHVPKYPRPSLINGRHHRPRNRHSLHIVAIRSSIRILMMHSTHGSTKSTPGGVLWSLKPKNPWSSKRVSKTPNPLCAQEDRRETTNAKNLTTTLLLSLLLSLLLLRSEYSPQWLTETRSFSFALARASPSLPRSVGSRRGQGQRPFTRPYQHWQSTQFAKAY